MGTSRVLAALVVGMLLLLPVSQVSAGQDRTCFGRKATIVGTTDDDTLIGTSKDDVIVALGGFDEVRGRGGDDYICSGSGGDRVFGGSGADHIREPRRSDNGLGPLRGGPGDDVIYGPYYGAVYGEKGDDELWGGDRVFGNAGNDHLIGFGAQLIGGTGRDTLEDLRRDGDDPSVAVYRGSPRRVHVDLVAGSAIGWGRDTLVRITHVIGGRFRDQITGSAGSDHLDGGKGRDELRGRGGNDFLIGGHHSDVIHGGRGRDQLWASSDEDASTDDAGDVLFGGRDDDVLTGSAGDDRERGGRGDDELWGDAGDDVLIGGRGRDSADGGDGSDRCRAEQPVSCE